VNTDLSAHECKGGAMIIDFTKHKRGDIIHVFCCDECLMGAGLKPKFPADSGTWSCYCAVCGHFGIGSQAACEIGYWLHLRPIQPRVPRIIHETA